MNPWNVLGKRIRLSLRRLLGLGKPPGRGALGEQVAARYLKRAGYRLLERNWRSASGEIDILALAPDRRTIVVVEVKSSASGVVSQGRGGLLPEVHVNGAKQRQLVLLATQVARRYRWTERPIRFDVVGVDLPAGAEPTVRHHVAAFQSHV